MKIKILLAALLCCFCFQVMRADDTDPGGTSTTVPLPTPDTTPLFPPVIPNHPNAPSRIYIGCSYGAGYVQLAFPEGIYSATVTISNGEDEWFGFASVDEPLMETPVFYGDYTIECIADNGRLFTGTLHF